VTETTDSSPEPQPDGGQSEPKISTAGTAETDAEPDGPPPPPGRGEEDPKKRSSLRELAILAVIAVVLYYVMLTFVARPYLIPSESMEPTLHGCTGCVGDRIMVDKLTYHFGSPHPGDVIVFKGPPNWN
jgi:signal peptidase I